MSVSNNPRTSGIEGSGIPATSTEESRRAAPSDGAPSVRPTPEALRGRPPSTSSAAPNKAENAIDNAVDSAPPRNAPENDAASVGADAALRAARFDKNTGLDAKLETVASLKIAAADREAQTAAAKNILFDSVNRAVALRMGGADAFSVEGVNRANEAIALHHLVVRNVETILESDEADDVAAAAAELKENMAALMGSVPNGPEREEAMRAAEHFAAVGAARRELLQAVDAALPGLVEAMEAAREPAGTSLGSLHRLAETTAKLDGLTQTGDPLLRPLVDDARIDDVCWFLDKAARLVEERALSGDAAQVDGQAPGDADMDEIFGLAGDAIGRRLGDADADDFRESVASIRELRQKLADDTAVADERIRRLDGLAALGMTGTAEDAATVQAALDEALTELFLTGEKRTELDDAIGRAMLLRSRVDASFEARETAGLEKLLAGDIAAGVKRANMLLSMKGLSDEFRAAIATAVGQALRDRNDAALAEINRINAELGKLIKLHAGDGTTGTTGQKASAADRTAMAELTQQLSARIAAAEKQLESDMALLDEEGGAAAKALGDAAQSARDGLRTVRENVAKVKAEGLREARDALAVLRFMQKVEHRLSIGIALDRGVAGLMRTLDQCRLTRENIADLTAKVASGKPPWEVGERARLREQLDLVLTRSQTMSDPLRTALNRLADPAKNLSSRDKEALLAAMTMLVPVDAAARIRDEVERVSGENRAAVAARAETLVNGAAEAAARLAGGGTDPADAKTVAAFGDRMGAVMRQAKSTLTESDYDALVKSTRPGLEAAADGIVAALAAQTGAKAMPPGQTAFVKRALIASGFNVKAATLLLEPGTLRAVMTTVSGTDALTAAAAWDAVLGEHPDLDDVCLDLKKTSFQGGESSPITDENSLRRIGQRHESDRLVRASKAHLRDAVLVSPSSRRARAELLALPPDQFLDRFTQGFGIAERLDLFIIQAMWLRSCGEIEGEVPPTAFEEFQAALPPPYDGRETLRNEIVNGLASTREMDACQNLVGDVASGFDRSRLSHRLLDFAGSILGSTFTRADLMDNLVASLAKPPLHAEASVARSGILSKGMGTTRTTRSVAADSRNVAIALPDGGGARLSFKERIGRFFHRVSKTTDFRNFATQVNRAAVRGNRDAAAAATTWANEDVTRLEATHRVALSAVLADVGVGKTGRFKSGVNMSLRVVALDAAIGVDSPQRAAWNVRQQNVRSIAPLKGWVNILAMEEKATGFQSSMSGASREFKALYDRMRNADNQADYEAAENAMQAFMGKHRLVDRANAVLVYSPASKDSLDKKLDAVLKNPTPMFRAVVSGAGEEVYQAMHRAKTFASDARKIAAGAELSDMSYHLSDAVIEGLLDASTAVLLELFENARPPVGFKAFVEAFAGRTGGGGFDRALDIMRDALVAKGVRPESAGAIAESFLQKAADRYLKAKGGPEALLKSQAGDVKDPDNLRYLDKQFKNHKASAKAVRDGLRRQNLDNLFARIHKNGACTLDVSQGFEVTYEDFTASLDIDNGITIRRDGQGRCSLVLSKGLTAGLSASFSAAADIATASIELEGSHSWGYQLDFADEEACKNFLAKILAGKIDSVAMKAATISVVTSTGVTLKAEASVNIGEKVDQVTSVVETARTMADRESSGIKDHSRVVDLELGVELSASFARESVRSGRSEESTHTLNLSASVEAKLKIGRGEGGIDEEREASAGFSSELKTRTVDGKLVGAVMTRNFTIAADATAEDVRGILADYGIDNPGAVAFVMDQLRSGQPLTLAVDARLTAFGLKKHEDVAAGGPEGLVRRAIILCDRDNFDVSAIRVVVTERGAGAEQKKELKKAAEGDDEAAEPTGSEEKGLVDTVKEGVGNLADKGRQLAVDAASNLLDKTISHEGIREGVKDRIGAAVMGGDDAPGLFDKVSVSWRANADGSITREYPFPVLPAA